MFCNDTDIQDIVNIPCLDSAPVGRDDRFFNVEFLFKWVIFNRLSFSTGIFTTLRIDPPPPLDLNVIFTSF